MYEYEHNDVVIRSRTHLLNTLAPDLFPDAVTSEPQILSNNSLSTCSPKSFFPYIVFGRKSLDRGVKRQETRSDIDFEIRRCCRAHVRGKVAGWEVGCDGLRACVRVRSCGCRRWRGMGRRQGQEVARRKGNCRLTCRWRRGKETVANWVGE